MQKNLHTKSTFALWTHAKCAINTYFSKGEEDCQAEEKEEEPQVHDGRVWEDIQKSERRVQCLDNHTLVCVGALTFDSLWVLSGTKGLMLTQSYWPQLRALYYTKVFKG